MGPLRPYACLGLNICLRVWFTYSMGGFRRSISPAVYIYIYIKIHIGGLGLYSTGKSFRFRSCVRAGDGRRSSVGEREAVPSWCWGYLGNCWRSVCRNHAECPRLSGCPVLSEDIVQHVCSHVFEQTHVKTRAFATCLADNLAGKTTAFSSCFSGKLIKSILVQHFCLPWFLSNRKFS